MNKVNEAAKIKEVTERKLGIRTGALGVQGNRLDTCLEALDDCKRALTACDQKAEVLQDQWDRSEKNYQREVKKNKAEPWIKAGLVLLGFVLGGMAAK